MDRATLISVAQVTDATLNGQMALLPVTYLAMRPQTMLYRLFLLVLCNPTNISVPCAGIWAIGGCCDL